ncbi:MAG: glycosyltransferase family 39 protein [Candidatus Omnitrophota bacterium]
MNTQANNQRFLLHTLLWVCIGVVLASWLIVSAGTLFVVSISILVGYMLWRKAEPQERVFLLGLFVLALVLRYLLIIYYYHLYLKTGAFPFLAPDGETLINKGWYISQVLLHRDTAQVPSNEYVMKFNWVALSDFGGKLPHWDQYQVGIYSYYLGVFFALFGYAPVATKCISALSAVSAGVVSYYIAKEIFGKSIARVSYVLLLFFPSIFIHSLTNLSDPFLLLFGTLSVWSLVKMAKRPTLFLLTVLAVSITAIYYLKKPLAPLIIAVAGLTFCNFLRMSAAKKVGIVIILMALIIGVGPLREKLVETQWGLNKLMLSHRQYSTLKGASYFIYPQRFYNEEILSVEGITPAETLFALLKGLLYFLFSPFPYSASLSAFGLISSWQNIFWYFLFPFSPIGIIAGLRHNTKKILPVFILLFLFTFILALSEGHSATSFRHRDLLMPGYLICAVAGFGLAFKKGGNTLERN